jgi:DNA-binding IclR family transcriptional regulator
MGILLALETTKMRLSELAKKKNLTATEASRRLQRMNEARLIQRDFEGFFSIAGYGARAVRSG